MEESGAEAFTSMFYDEQLSTEAAVLQFITSARIVVRETPFQAKTAATSRSTGGDVDASLTKSGQMRLLEAMEHFCLEIENWVRFGMHVIDCAPFDDNFDFVDQFYCTFLRLFPTCGPYWIKYVEFHFYKTKRFDLVEKLFTSALKCCASCVEVWKSYLSYIKRSKKQSTSYNRIMCHAYECALENVGVDHMATAIWIDFVEFLKQIPTPSQSSGSTRPGALETQKLSQIRKTCHRAIATPLLPLVARSAEAGAFDEDVRAAESLDAWTTFSQFEFQMFDEHKGAAQKLTDDKLPLFLSSKRAARNLDMLYRAIKQDHVWPPPEFCARHFTKEQMHTVRKQIKLWRRLVVYEKANPMKMTDANLILKRVQHAYDKFCACFCYWPMIWCDASACLEACSILPAHRVSTSLNSPFSDASGSYYGGENSRSSTASPGAYPINVLSRKMRILTLDKALKFFVRSTRMDKDDGRTAVSQCLAMARGGVLMLACELASALVLSEVCNDRHQPNGFASAAGAEGMSPLDGFERLQTAYKHDVDFDPSMIYVQQMLWSITTTIHYQGVASGTGDANIVDPVVDPITGTDTKATVGGLVAARQIFKVARQDSRCDWVVYVAAAQLEEHHQRLMEAKSSAGAGGQPGSGEGSVAKRILQLALKKFSGNPAFLRYYVSFMGGSNGANVPTGDVDIDQLLTRIEKQLAGPVGMLSDTIRSNERAAVEEPLAEDAVDGTETSAPSTDASPQKKARNVLDLRARMLRKRQTATPSTTAVTIADHGAHRLLERMLGRDIPVDACVTHPFIVELGNNVSFDDRPLFNGGVLSLWNQVLEQKRTECQYQRGALLPSAQYGKLLERHRRFIWRLADLYTKHIFRCALFYNRQDWFDLKDFSAAFGNFGYLVDKYSFCNVRSLSMQHVEACFIASFPYKNAAAGFRVLTGSTLFQQRQILPTAPELERYHDRQKLVYKYCPTASYSERQMFSAIALAPATLSQHTVRLAMPNLSALQPFRPRRKTLPMALDEPLCVTRDTSCFCASGCYCPRPIICQALRQLPPSWCFNGPFVNVDMLMKILSQMNFPVDFNPAEFRSNPHLFISKELDEKLQAQQQQLLTAGPGLANGNAMSNGNSDGGPQAFGAAKKGLPPAGDAFRERLAKRAKQSRSQPID